MFGITNYTTFLITGIILNLTPGSDTLYILSRSISQGKKAGILSALAISCGSIFHTIFAAMGLSIILSQSLMAFNIVKYAGAAYLIFLGIKTLLSKNVASAGIAEIKSELNYRKIFISGIVTNLLNPKVALFFLAFLPQFIDPSYSNHAFSFVMLGLTFVTTGTIWCLILAIYSSKLANAINKSDKVKLWLDKITGIIFISLGLKLALMKK